MNEYPDRWVIVRIKAPTHPQIYKVLAGWNGSYLNGSAWRINSGIVRATIEDDYFVFEGFSGSKYYCHKNAYGHTSLTANIAHSYGGQLAKDGVEFEVLPEQTDFLSLVYGE